MRIGFIGLGNMGSGMAANLLAAGHEVMAYNRSPEKAAALVEVAPPATTTHGKPPGLRRCSAPTGSRV